MTADAAIRPASTSTMNVESKSSFSWSNMLDGNTRVWYRSAGEGERGEACQWRDGATLLLVIFYT